MFIVEAESDSRLDDKTVDEVSTLAQAVITLRDNVREELEGTDWGESDDMVAQRDISDREQLVESLSADDGVTRVTNAIRSKGRFVVKVGDPSYLEVEYRIISRPENN